MNPDTPEQTNAETDETARNVNVRLRRLARLRKLTEQCRLVYFVTAFLWFLSHWLLPVNLTRIYLSFFFAASTFIWLGMHILFSARYKNTVKLLHLFGDVSNLGALLDIITFELDVPQQELKAPLIRLLNQVQASDGALLNAGHRRKLYALLLPEDKRGKKFYDVDLMLATVKALEQVGDKDAIAPVERVASNSREPYVRRAAEECLVFLRQRASEQSATNTLLRASDANTAAPETLLRATIARPDEQPATLLRANAAPDERKA